MQEALLFGACTLTHILKGTTKRVVMVTDTQLLTQSLLRLNAEGEVSLLSVTMVILMTITEISKFIFLGKLSSKICRPF